MLFIYLYFHISVFKPFLYRGALQYFAAPLEKSQNFLEIQKVAEPQVPVHGNLVENRCSSSSGHLIKLNKIGERQLQTFSLSSLFILDVAT